jgi:hypothetical protein
MSFDPIATEYTLDPFHSDYANGHHWQIQIARRTYGQWLIRNSGFWLQPGDDWYPSMGSAVRFDDLDSAVEVAREALKTVDVNGVTWDAMCAKWGTP